MAQEVGGCGLNFEPDILEGFEHATLHLAEETDGELQATLIRKRESHPNARGPAVLYIHGFVDYFFQTHLADAFESAGYRFYALDLRRYGRSLREENRANQASTAQDYFEEMTWALEQLELMHSDIAALIAHSTGALIASLYLDRGERRDLPRSFVMNSAFFKFNLNWFEETQTRFVATVARFFPTIRLPQAMNGVYAQTLHQTLQGEWNYDLRLKPPQGFPLYSGWFRLIRAAQREVQSGLRIEIPVLSLFSDRSHRPEKHIQDIDFVSDVVLNVDHIRELSPLVGKNVTLVAIKHGVHDLTLSENTSREAAIREMVSFVDLLPPRGTP